MPSGPYRPTVISIAPEYVEDAYAWDHSPGEAGGLGPSVLADLGAGTDLLARLHDWNATCAQRAATGFQWRTAQSRADREDEGLQLALELQRQLPDLEVHYGAPDPSRPSLRQQLGLPPLPTVARSADDKHRTGVYACAPSSGATHRPHDPSAAPPEQSTGAPLRQDTHPVIPRPAIQAGSTRGIEKPVSTRRWPRGLGPVMRAAGRSTLHAPPPHVLFGTLARPGQDSNRAWLRLHPDEQQPQVVAAEEPTSLTWSSLWPELPTARIRLELSGEAGGGRLTWTLLLQDPLANASEVRRLRYRINQLVNGDLRDRFDD
ncbi:hypothetical protein [Kineococcus auxinigenes]|uniref:hypothetical protein n=1 Tax=unclassified Kineococcus TaxID=2621656 RepID=UPI003D7C81C0